MSEITFENFEKIGNLPTTASDNKTFSILWAFTTVLWILVFLNYDAKLATLYLFLHLAAGLMFLLQGVPFGGREKTISTFSYGSAKNALSYLLIGGIIAAVFTFTVASIFPTEFALIAPFAVVTPLPFAFLFTIDNMVYALAAVMLVGVIQPVIEEHFMGFFTGLSANLSGKPGESGALKAMLVSTLVVMGIFVIFHLASYTQQIQNNWNDYQSALALSDIEAAHPCQQGYYFEPKINACNVIPPAPGTAEAWSVLMGMLFWVAFFRFAITAIGIFTNSMWAMIIAHSIHNIIVTAFIILKQPVFAAFGFIILFVLYGLWAVTAKNDSPALSWG